MQEPRIVTISEIKLVGKRIRTSLAQDQTRELWKSFHPHVHQIENMTGSGLYSVQVFDDDLSSESFTPETLFEKWAAVEVNDFTNLNNGMENLTLAGGKYAVFIHKGLSSDFQKTSQYIHTKWLPGTFYELDNRPHFEVMKNDYDPNDPEAEEEVWIPIKDSEVGYDL
ncbi:GyrI-like domain-containing protein [Gracilimonas sp.]|uniref:GyrI-like domain-containing protein n=1 Tax=Gracilimonas sp. TaxID=1974203 RepID=UPI003BA86E30